MIWVALFLTLAAHLADLFSTKVALRMGAMEANPLGRRFGLWQVKISMIAATWFVQCLVDPRIALLVGVVSLAILLPVAWWNLRRIQ